jgi:hypothetical protein
VLATGAAFDHAWTVAAVLGTAALFFILRTFQECAGATTAILDAIKCLKTNEA